MLSSKGYEAQLHKSYDNTQQYSEFYYNGQIFAPSFCPLNQDGSAFVTCLYLSGKHGLHKNKSVIQMITQVLTSMLSPVGQNMPFKVNESCVQCTRQNVTAQQNYRFIVRKQAINLPKEEECQCKQQKIKICLLAGYDVLKACIPQVVLLLSTRF